MKRITLLLSIICMALAVNPLAAQQQQDTESSMLPEIDPQDIEIRSQFRAQFPGLRRQPILGFDPNPRVYQIDPNRMPFMETQEEVVANLPVSQLSRPEPPPYYTFDYSEPRNLFARLGFGSYASPEAKVWGVSRLNEKSYVGGDLDFSSSDGHLDQQNSSFRFFDANAEYATKLTDKSRLDITGGAKSSFNNLFDLPALANVPATARKNYNGVQLGVGFEHFKNTVTGWKADANVRYYNMEFADAGALNGKSEERVYDISLAKRWAGASPNETITLKIGTRGGNFDNTNVQSNWLTAQAGGTYERLINYSTKLTVDANIFYAQDDIEDTFYVGPEVTIEHPLLDILTLKAKVGAKPYLKSLEKLHTRNRFLALGNMVQHSYRKYGSAEANVEYSARGVFNFGFQYEDISNYSYFLRSDNGLIGGTGNPLYGYYEVQYIDAYKVSAYAGMAHEIIPKKLNLNGKVYLQSPKIKDGGRLPFEEKIGVNAGVTIQPVEGVSFEAWTDYVGSRRTAQTDEKLSAFLLLGGQADVQITKRIGAYVKLVNLLNQDYEVWQGYSERPFQAFGGVTIKL